MKRSKNGWTSFFLVVIFLVGAGLFFYPSVSSYWSARHQSETITAYALNTADSNKEWYDELWAEATAYNGALAQSGIDWLLSDEEKEVYNEYLKVDSTGVMAYIDIPAIDCSLPVYHGSGDAALQVGVGHIEGSSLPVGGQSSHCILTGHTGLPSAELFTNLDMLEEGDTFILHTLDRTLTYEVDRIYVVEPTDLSQLQIEEGKDYCTLVTCTPYGINTHRLLVRGHRID